MRKLLFAGLLIFIFSGIGFSQEFLGDDMAFFQKKAQLYQHWLEKKDLGSSLSVDTFKLEKNGTELELWLSLDTSDPDSAAGIWTALQESFVLNNPGKTLQETLFKTFSRMMEIPPAQGNVQVYFKNKSGNEYNPCFSVWLWEENGKIEREERIKNCKSLDLEVEVEVERPKQIASASQLDYKSFELSDSRNIFDKILDFTHYRYVESRTNDVKQGDSDMMAETTDKGIAQAESDDLPLIGDKKITDYKLTFSVSNLRKEVLINEEKSLWCKFVSWWGSDCDDVKRERLEFEFIFIPTPKGYTLLGEVTGKFGSGIYKPRTSGYMDMEPDFQDDFLKPYIAEFQNELKEYLKKEQD